MYLTKRLAEPIFGVPCPEKTTGVTGESPLTTVSDKVKIRGLGYPSFNSTGCAYACFVGQSRERELAVKQNRSAGRMRARALLQVISAVCVIITAASSNRLPEGDSKRDLCHCCRRLQHKFVAVDCSDCDLETIPTCNWTNVRVLDLSGNLLKTLENLSAYRELEELDVSENLLEDISNIRNNKHLKKLTMESNFISDVSHLGALSTLTDIDLSDNCLNLKSPNFSEASLKHLTRLNLRSCCIRDETLSKAIPIHSFHSLRQLDISSNGGITSLSYIVCNLMNLETLKVARNPIQDLNSLLGSRIKKQCETNFHNLKHLDLSKTLVSSLEPLIVSNISRNLTCLKLGSLTIRRPHLGAFFNSSLFPNLTQLALQEATFHNRTLQPSSPLNQSFKLKELDMSGIQLTDLQFLSHATDIETLRLSWVTPSCTARNIDRCQKLSLSTLSRLSSLKHLDLSYSLIDLTSLPNFKTLDQLVFLDLTGSTTQDGFESVSFTEWDSLRVLNISQTRLSNITDRLVPKNLTHLNISFNQLVNFTSIAFHLQSLDASITSDTSATITDWQFLQHTNKLKYLQVNGQRHFQLKYLHGLTELNSLHLRDTHYFCNDMNHTEDDIQLAVQNKCITELDIGNTCFTKFSLLGNMTELVSLTADRNRITNIEVAAQMTELEILNLGQNPTLSNISSLKYLTALAELTLDFTAVGSNVHCVITTLPKLAFLSLSHTRVSAVENVIGSSNSIKPNQLKYLMMDHNGITSLQSSVFYGMNKLRLINLSSCSLEMIPSEAFSSLSSLKYLDLSDNEDMQTVERGSIHHCPNLKGVWLRNNPITDFDYQNFGSTPNLRLLVAYQCATCCIAFSGGKKRKLPGSLPSGCQCEKKLAGTASCRNLVSKGGLEAVMGVESCLAIIGNIFVLVWRLKLVFGSCQSSEDRSRRNANGSNSSSRRKLPVAAGWMIITLAIADLCMGLYLLTIMIADQVYDSHYALYAIDWTYSPWCKLASFLSVFSTQLSVSVLLTMAIATLWSHVRTYQNGTANKIVVILLALETIAAALVAATPVILQNTDNPRALWSGICMPLAVQQELVFEFALPLMTAYTLCILVSASAYVYLACLTCKVRKIGFQQSHNNYNRTVRRLTLIVIVDILCYLPSFVLLTIDPAVHSVISYELTAYVTLLTLPINAAANPILYTVSSEAFVNWLKKRSGSSGDHDDSDTESDSQWYSSKKHPSETATLLPYSDSESDADTGQTESTSLSDGEEDNSTRQLVESSSGDQQIVSSVRTCAE